MSIALDEQGRMSKEEAKLLGMKRITFYYINYNFIIKKDKNAAFGYSLKAFIQKLKNRNKLFQAR